MFQNPFESNAAVESVLKACVPFTKFVELTAKNFERAARFQVENTLDLVNHSVACVEAAVGARNPQQIIAGQSDLAGQLYSKSVQKWETFVQASKEGQGEFAKWAEDTKSHFVAAATPAA
jgi:hypothetical protein